MGSTRHIITLLWPVDGGCHITSGASAQGLPLRTHNAEVEHTLASVGLTIEAKMEL